MQNRYRINGIYILISIVGVGLYLSMLFIISNSNKKIEPIIFNEQKINIAQDKEKTQLEPIIEDEITNESLTYMVIVDGVNVREKPNIKSNIIKKYKYMDELKIINENNGWGEIENGGFVFMKLLQKKLCIYIAFLVIQSHIPNPHFCIIMFSIN